MVMGLTEGFFIFLVTSSITCSLAVFRMLYKSKCRSVECCGVKIVRDVRAEEHLDQQIPRTQSMQPERDFV